MSKNKCQIDSIIINGLAFLSHYLISDQIFVQLPLPASQPTWLAGQCLWSGSQSYKHLSQMFLLEKNDTPCTLSPIPDQRKYYVYNLTIDLFSLSNRKAFHTIFSIGRPTKFNCTHFTNWDPPPIELLCFIMSLCVALCRFVSLFVAYTVRGRISSVICNGI